MIGNFFVRLVIVPLLLFSYLIKLTGRRGLLFFGHALGLILLFFGFRKKIVQSNLQLAYGNEKTPEELSILLRKIYKNVGLTFLEIARNFTLTTEDLHRELILLPEDEKKLREIQGRGRGAVVISAHIANWELFGMGIPTYNIPVGMVVKKMTNPIAQELIEQRRARTGVVIIYPGGTLEKMKECLRQNIFIGCMMDQHIHGKNAVRTNFFGVPVASIRGFAQLARETRVPFIPICCFRTGKGDQVVKLYDEIPYLTADELPENSPERVAREEYLNTQQYQKAIEVMVREHPEEWLWIHRRWKADRTPIKDAI
jgi:Kdo2-lipid IVA lauroyltransferase/acyltransferase